MVRSENQVMGAKSDSSAETIFLRKPPSLPNQLKVGDTLGKLLLTDYVGQGATGRVFRALHQTLQIPVAVKILQSEKLANDPRLYEQLKWEARMMAQLNHPNIVRVWDFEDNPELPYIVLEVVEGLSLADLIGQTGRLRLSRAVEIVLQVAEGLGAIHRFGIIHRDVKPGNILLTKDRVPKLVDLGIAAVISREKLTGYGFDEQQNEVVGTPAYLAPEQFLAPATVDHRADIYALGATFYHAITGKYPFEGKTPRVVMMRKLQDIPPVPPHELVPGLNPSVAEVIGRMMAREPDDRYQDHVELITALKEIETCSVSLADLFISVNGIGGMETRKLGTPQPVSTGPERRPPQAKQATREGNLPEKGQQREVKTVPISKEKTTSQATRLLREGVGAAKAGDKLLATTLLQKLIKLEPTHEIGLLWLVSVLDNSPEKIGYLERILENNPTQERAQAGLQIALVQVGIAEAKKGNRSEAKKYLTRAVERDPRSEPAWCWLAKIAESTPEAVAALERVLEINPQNESARTALDRMQGTRAEGGTCPLCQAPLVKTSPQCSSCGALIRLQNFDVWKAHPTPDSRLLKQALTRYGALLEKKPEARVYYHLALCRLNGKQFDLATRDLEVVAQMTPASHPLGQQAAELLRQLKEAPSRIPASETGRAGTVLVVDQSPTIRKVVTKALKEYDYRVMEAANGEEALAFLKEDRVDVVLLDLNLPRVNGYEVCKAIRANKKIANLPVILLSDRGGLFARLRARLAGATQFLAKPFGPDVLVQVVAHHCRKP